MLDRLVRGAAAGAAGTAALNATTYLDMAVRGRPASDTPERTVAAMAGRARLPVPGSGETREHRLTGLGALSGAATGASVGAGFGALRALGFRPRPAVGWLLVGLAAMAAANLPMIRLGITDPRGWSRADWLSDLLPHLVYGAVTATTLAALDPDRPR